MWVLDLGGGAVRVRQVVARLAGTALAAGALSVVSTPVHADEAPLVLPEGPLAGDVDVVTNVPVDQAAYLRLSFPVPAPGRAQTRGYSPVVTNTGASMSTPFATWGLSGSTQLRLDGCDDRYGSSCAPLAETEVEVAQTAPVTGTVEFRHQPDQAVSSAPPVVAGHNSGGGKLVARWTFDRSPGSAFQVPLVDGEPTEVVVPAIDGEAHLGVARCSTYISMACETWVDEPTYLVQDLDVSLWSERSELSTDPAFGTSRTYLRAVSGATVVPQTWRLERTDGTTAIGPLPPGSSEGSSPGGFELDLAGTGAVGGDYVLRVEYRRYGLDEVHFISKSAVLPLRVIGGSSTAGLPQLVRRSSADIRWTGASAHSSYWTIGAPPPAWQDTGVLEVRDAGGRLVTRQQVSPCTTASARCAVGDYLAIWSGTQPRGRYFATARFVDDALRVVTMPLGEIRIWQRRTLQKTVTFPAARVRVRTGRVEGSCSDITVPGPSRVKDSVGLLSGARCSSTDGKDHWVKQRFALRIPQLPTGVLRSVEVSANVKGAGSRTTFTMPIRYTLPTSRWTHPWQQYRAARSRVTSTDRVGWYFPHSSRSTSQVSGKSLGVQFTVDNGNRVEVRSLTADVEYDAWTLT